MALSRLLVLSVAILGLVGAGCSSMRVSADWDAEADFSGMHTFAAVERDDAGPRHGQRQGRDTSPLVDVRVERSVTAELSARGFSGAPRRVADLLVSAEVLISARVVRTHTGWGYPRRWRWGGTWGATTVHRYREGTLVIDIFDRQRRTLVWRGIGEAAFTKPNPSEQEVRRAVAKVLESFPPR